MLVRQLELELGRDGVGQIARILDAVHRCQNLGRQTLVQLDETRKGRVRLSSRGLGLGRPLGVFQNLIDLDSQKTFAVYKAPHHRAPLALDQDFHRPVGQAQDLDHVGQRPHRKNVFRGRLVALHALRGKEDFLVVAARSDLAQRAQRFLAAHKERHHHMGEDHGVAQGQERNATNPGCLVVTVGQGQPFCAAP